MTEPPALTPELVAAKGLLASPRWSPSGTQVAWVRGTQDGTEIVVAPVSGSGEQAVVGAGVALAADIDVFCPHPTSGTLAWIDDDTLLVCTKSEHFTVVPVSGGPDRLLPALAGSSAPVVSPDGREVAFVSETNDACFVAVMPVDGSTPPARVSTADFAFDPQWAPNGRALVWQAWDLPHMAFHESRVERAPRGDDGAFGAPELVVGGAGVATAQPRFSPDGRFLSYCSDADGVMRVHVIDLPYGTEQIVVAVGEHASPTWGTGDRSYAWAPTGHTLAINTNLDGFGALHIVDLEGDVEPRQVAKAWHRSIDWGPTGIVAVRSGAKTPPQLVHYAAPTAPEVARAVVAYASVPTFARVVEPVPVAWERDGETLHGLWWAQPDADGPQPVMVHLHGGPTDQATADWDARRQFFVGQGWAVFTPNPRGSTGYGRAYNDGLSGGWGVVDLEDVAAGIEQVVRAQGGDPDRIVAMGGSAGGYLVLRLCTEYPNLLGAAISVYGVTDLLGLAATTWRRESGYEDWLVGPLPECEPVYRDRSPLFAADRIRTPLLLLQGDSDKVVDISQYESLLAAVQRNGTPVEGHVYADEGHGWSNPATKADELGRITAFLGRTLPPPHIARGGIGR